MLRPRPAFAAVLRRWGSRSPTGSTGTRRIPHHVLGRDFSTPPLQQVDRSVRTAIQKMMDDYSELSSSSSSSSSVDSVKGAAEPWDLPQALQSLQNQLHEAESCVQDCRDCASSAALDTELATADGAIDLAVQRLLDVLDAVRYSSSAQPVPCDADWAPRIKQLRAQVNLLKHERLRQTTETVG